MKKKRDKDYIDFGQWLYETRKQHNFTEEDLVEKINMLNVQKINIKKWERDLEFPDLDVIYKLSEIYMIPSAEIIYKKQKTLQSGVDGIHVYFIRVLSLILGISFYATYALTQIIIYGTLILLTLWFGSLARR